MKALQLLLRAQVLTVVSTFPQLRELRLAGNGIADLQPAADLMPSGFRNLQARTCAVGGAAPISAGVQHL